ncbi:MAG: hypothetical protein ICV60_15570 [Pyrinomonadaceae bacterium]|nr:hypothetical protein [Pyrinomonadaceae bacterium]
MKRTLIPLMLCAAFGLLLVACGGSDSSSNTTTTNTTNTATGNKGGNTNTTNTTTTTTTTSSSGDKLGIPECDEYIAKYEACINSKVPEAQRAQVKTTLDQSRAAWRTAASTPQGKASLPGLCKTAMDNARTAMKSYGCDF